MPHCSFIAAGRCGNFLMTCASVWAYAKRHGLNFTVPATSSHPVWSPIYLHHLIDPSFDPSLETIEIVEKQFHYYPLPFNESWREKNIIFRGYFQSYLRFDEYRKEMLKAFAIPYKIKRDTCSIHARYGDYLTVKGKHIIVDEPYLKSAMEEITKRTGIKKFKVFSDDIPMFKSRHGHLYDFEYSTNNDVMADLIEASYCHSNIGSSSTFSFWIAYLNRNPKKVIITQRLWFQVGWRETDREVLTDDIIPPDWIKL